jgi:hypothetical protein
MVEVSSYVAEGRVMLLYDSLRPPDDPEFR